MLYYKGKDESSMPNKHLEHPEDNILNGVNPYDVLDSMVNFDKVTTKWDGAPAIVFGYNEGKWFVGTKSVFNKKKVLINYSVNDIVKNHTGNVAQILTACFYALPRSCRGIYQADFIGFGGNLYYKPNTVLYLFPEIMNQDVIVAPHTLYKEISPTAQQYPLDHVVVPGTPIHNNKYRFLRHKASLVVPKRARLLSQAAKLLIPFCKFPKGDTSTSATCSMHIKKHVNKFVRAGYIPSASELYNTLDDKYKEEVNIMTFRLYHIILKLKDILLSCGVADEPVECYIEGKPINHEGFVLTGKHSVKLVNRLEFSQANFNSNKNWNK